MNFSLFLEKINFVLLKNKGKIQKVNLKNTKNYQNDFFKMYIFVNCRKSNKKFFLMISLYINVFIKMVKKANEMGIEIYYFRS